MAMFKRILFMILTEVRDLSAFERTGRVPLFSGCVEPPNNRMKPYAEFANPSVRDVIGDCRQTLKALVARKLVNPAWRKIEDVPKRLAGLSEDGSARQGKLL